MGKINNYRWLPNYPLINYQRVPLRYRDHRAQIANDDDCDEMLKKTTAKTTTKIPDDEEDADITGATDNKGGGR